MRWRIKASTSGLVILIVSAWAPLDYHGIEGMHWDVVEVQPESGYWLFVRFKDGFSGRVQLTTEEMTGVLAPLKEWRFFQQVFIDDGPVAWPGEIDLAPDAMYSEIAGRR